MSSRETDDNRLINTENSNWIYSLHLNIIVDICSRDGMNNCNEHRLVIDMKNSSCGFGTWSSNRLQLVAPWFSTVLLVCQVWRCFLPRRISSNTVRTSGYLSSFSFPTPVSLSFMPWVMVHFSKLIFFTFFYNYNTYGGYGYPCFTLITSILTALLSPLLFPIPAATISQ